MALLAAGKDGRRATAWQAAVCDAAPDECCQVLAAKGLQEPEAALQASIRGIRQCSSVEHFNPSAPAMDFAILRGVAKGIISTWRRRRLCRMWRRFRPLTRGRRSGALGPSRCCAG